jgi:fructose-1,6-bisphosphatase-3
LLDSHWPTFNAADPFALTPEEVHVINRLSAAFLNSEKLQRHIAFLYSKGSLYLRYNSNLLFHGCIPISNDGQLMALALDGTPRKGRELMDWLDAQARAAYFSKNAEEKSFGEDILWFLWAGRHSPVFGKTKMTTFERYFCADKELHHEPTNQYFSLRDREEFCSRILKEFDLSSKKSRIINGHVPVKVKKGESPIKAGGKLLVIDGGFARAYQEETGIAGYTLIASSHGMFLAAHPPFESTKKAIAEEIDVIPERFVVEKSAESIAIRDTDNGKSLLDQIRNLELLISAYQRGLVPAE